MEDKRDLCLTNVQIDEEEEMYRLNICPLLCGGESIALYWERSGDTILQEWTVEDDWTRNVIIEKKLLQKQAYAYLVKKEGDNKGVPFRILTRTPDIRQILFMPDGKIRICVDIQDEYSESAGLQIEILAGERKSAALRLHQGEREFDLAQAGIVTKQSGLIRLRIRFYTEDENHYRMTGAQTDVELALNPPKIVRVVGEESQIAIRVADEPKKPLYARICQAGRPLYMLPCERDVQTAVDYVVSTDQLNLMQGAYTVEIACWNEGTFSYWSEPVPVLMKPPVIERIQAGNAGRIIWMEECGHYFWQEKYERTDRIMVADRKIPEIRYANQYDSVISLSPPAKAPDRIENCFYLQEGCYRLAEAEMVCELQEIYKEEYCNNDSFQIIIGDNKSASLHILIRESSRQRVKEDFKKLLESVCKTYAQLEELTGCFGHMPLMAEDMLGVRYGYDAGEGYCDLHAGMELCFDYEQYQNIPEVKPLSEAKECDMASKQEDSVRADMPQERQEDEITNQELSGFTGSGSSTFPCVLRNGEITFEPFARGMNQDMGFIPAGREPNDLQKVDLQWERHVDGCPKDKFGMVIEAPKLDGVSIGMAAGIWDALFAGFSKPFVRLLCPQEWKRSECTNYGSVKYFDNICLAAADTYQKLVEATDQYYQRGEMLRDVCYVCFRGRTAIRIMIHIFVEGHPQVCALGTTLGDMVTAYGLGSRVRLERLCQGRHVLFADASMDIPLYIGDRICSG